MATVIGMVAFILIMIGVSTSAILSQVLLNNLDAQVTEVAQRAQSRVSFQTTAENVLDAGPFDNGTLMVVSSRAGTTGAVVDDGASRALTADELEQIVESLRTSTPNTRTVELPNLGEYLVKPYSSGGGDNVILVGLPLSQVTGTIGAILTTVALVTCLLYTSPSPRD